MCPPLDGSEGGDDLSAMPPGDQSDGPDAPPTESEQPGTEDLDPGLSIWPLIL